MKRESEMAAPGEQGVDESALIAECRVFTRFLVAGAPDAYITETYVAAHSRRAEFGRAVPGDEVLLSLARWSPVGTRLADAHSRIFAPASLLRRKLVLLLAILETSPLFCERIDDPGSRSWLGAVLRLVSAGLMATLALLLGTLLLLPLRLVRRQSKAPR